MRRSCRRRGCPTGAARGGCREDAGLIRYLMRHRHSTPFEMCEIKYHVKLPIFVARQWIRHRTANVNEYSARYSILDREFYLPAPEHLAAQSRGQPARAGARCWTARRRRTCWTCCARTPRACYDHYAEMLNEDDGGDAARSVAPGPRARAGADEPDAQHLHAVVLEDRPAQPACTSCRCAPTRTRSTRSAPMPRRCWRRCGPGFRPPSRRSSTTGSARSRSRRRCWPWCGGCWRARRWSRPTAGCRSGSGRS